MPLVEYACLDCETLFEVLNGVSQDQEDLICPACGSPNAERALSTFAAKVSAGAKPTPQPPSPACGSCCACHH
jgi:putative FmdB family regulatory protein